jgi:hypothetical protein
VIYLTVRIRKLDLPWAGGGRNIPNRYKKTSGDFPSLSGFCPPHGPFRFLLVSYCGRFPLQLVHPPEDIVNITLLFPLVKTIIRGSHTYMIQIFSS